MKNKKLLILTLYTSIFAFVFIGCKKEKFVEEYDVADIHFDIEDTETFIPTQDHEKEKTDIVKAVTEEKNSREGKRTKLDYSLVMETVISGDNEEENKSTENEFYAMLERQEENGKSITTYEFYDELPDENHEVIPDRLFFYRADDKYYMKHESNMSIEEQIYDLNSKGINVIDLDSLSKKWKKVSAEEVPDELKNDFCNIDLSKENLVLENKLYKDKNRKEYYVMRGEVPFDKIRDLISGSVFMRIFDYPYIEYDTDINAKVSVFIETEHPENTITYINMGYIPGTVNIPESDSAEESEKSDFPESSQDAADEISWQEDPVSEDTNEDNITNINIKKFVIRITQGDTTRTIPSEDEILKQAEE